MNPVQQVLRVILIIGIILTLLLAGGFIGIFAADAIFGPKASSVSNVSYPAADGSTLLAYINIQPGMEIRPGIIMAPDFWGLDLQITRLANLLADEGYVVIAPDLYRGSATAMLPRARLLGLLVPGDRIMNDMQSAYDYLLTVDTVDPNAIGIIGLGYGGGAALRYAAQNPNVTAVVDAYGEVLNGPDELGDLRGPVMGLFASRDSLVHPTQVDHFRVLLNDAGIENEITVYDKLSTGFFHFPEITVIGSAVHVAWREVVAFFDTNLKSR
jgi:carboxymethylenebutenolidase